MFTGLSLLPVKDRARPSFSREKGLRYEARLVAAAEAETARRSGQQGGTQAHDPSARGIGFANLSGKWVSSPLRAVTGGNGKASFG